MTTDPFRSTEPQIIASILSANFAKLGAEIEDVIAGGADFLHLDIMDGHFVPNISFGPAICKAVRATTTAFLDAHLMISDPLRYAPAFVKAGVNGITFHVETVRDPVATAKELRTLGCRVGVTMNPGTQVKAIFDVIEHVDVVLVMSVEPGFSGQPFMPAVLPKCEAIRKRLAPHQRLQIDGGIGPDTIRSARDAGVDWFVAASAIFAHNDRAAAIRALRQKLA